MVLWIAVMAFMEDPRSYSVAPRDKHCDVDGDLNERLIRDKIVDPCVFEK